MKKMIVITPTAQAAIDALPEPEKSQVMRRGQVMLSDLSKHAEPSMAFGDPKFAIPELADEGRSLHTPCPIRLWCKRDDYEAGVDDTFPDGGQLFTFMLPEDY